jgi:7,8-dihydropterin-6-yl-methyl-4-(beta-D-ribofuranosyl)aminobenzene 5'-phosphate synthase
VIYRIFFFKNANRKIFVICILKYLILSEVDHISITLLMDNYTDRLIPESYPAIRPLMIKNKRFLPPPIAEHGFSALINIHSNYEGEKRYPNNTYKGNTFLFDCGVSENGVLYNADILGIDFKSINAIILSQDILITLQPFQIFLKK